MTAVDRRAGRHRPCPVGFGNFSGRSMVIGGGSAGWPRATSATAPASRAMLTARPTRSTWPRPGAGAARGAACRRRGRGDPDPRVRRRPTTSSPCWSPPAPTSPATSTNARRAGPDPAVPDLSIACTPRWSRSTPRPGRPAPRLRLAHDCGTMINPALVEGQAHGAVAMALGGALSRRCASTRTGACSPTVQDLPAAPRRDMPLAAHGAPGDAEPVHDARQQGGRGGRGRRGAGGGRNAVEDALAPLGVEVREIPLTPPSSCA